ncbi:hypothetical protein ACWGPT_01575 [Pseudorhizobium sp. NPDC055634]
MEAERIFAEALPCRVRIATPRELAVLLDEEPIDLLVLDVDLAADVLSLVRRRQASGTRVILTMLMPDDRAWVAELPGSTPVTKPFMEDDLLAAARAAGSPTMPELEP